MEQTWVRFDWRLAAIELPLCPVPGYRLRQAVRDDVDDMLAVVGAAYASDPAWEGLTVDIEQRVGRRIREHIEDSRAYFAVAEHNGKIAGLNGVALDHPTRQNLITGICVAPAHQGRGLGTALLATSLAWLRDRGLATATVTTDARSVAARVYARFGAIRTSGVTYDDPPRAR